ncbi:kunitz-type serine protease inhibitor microlepidin-4 [Drosophila rhopaloa]|uniref:Kunitz-type serine protease inhibitor microlepidin-4-like n=1 Tax=Drosophila rhopaloa TaxID=1041015 RepID=A0A6P4F180_DRORH|nr:kunitz-type serine protease inhibitor microlepidin-4 [Drosophila rhopaloa]
MNRLCIALTLITLFGFAVALKSPICGIKASFVGKCKGFAYIPQKNRCVRISGDCSGKGNFFKRLEACEASCL